ncbi:MAG: hypothetical protein C0515_07955 [Novosphingobium sp.]|nr:hypothetical protein [Novosphingobium sp.]
MPGAQRIASISPSDRAGQPAGSSIPSDKCGSSLAPVAGPWSQPNAISVLLKRQAPAMSAPACRPPPSRSSPRRPN